MARPKGRKDTKPRKVNPESLKNLSKTTWRVPGRKFVRTGILLNETEVDAFLKLTNLEKGDIVSAGLHWTQIHEAAAKQPETDIP